MTIWMVRSPPGNDSKAPKSFWLLQQRRYDHPHSPSEKKQACDPTNTLPLGCNLFDKYEASEHCNPKKVHHSQHE